MNPAVAREMAAENSSTVVVEAYRSQLRRARRRMGKWSSNSPRHVSRLRDDMTLDSVSCGARACRFLALTGCTALSPIISAIEGW